MTKDNEEEEDEDEDAGANADEDEDEDGLRDKEAVVRTRHAGIEV